MTAIYAMSWPYCTKKVESGRAKENFSEERLFYELQIKA